MLFIFYCFRDKFDMEFAFGKSKFLFRFHDGLKNPFSEKRKKCDVSFVYLVNRLPRFPFYSHTDFFFYLLLSFHFVFPWGGFTELTEYLRIDGSICLD